MTREEKSKAIEAWCNDCNDCDDCPLNKSCQWFFENCTFETEKFPCDIDRNYAILVKAGCIKDEEEEAKQRFMNIRDDDKVNHPNHYTKGGIECISAIKASMTSDGFCDYCKGNIIKYIWRWRDKGGIQDLEKAKVYLDWLIEEEKECI